MKEATVTYTAPKGDNKVVEMFGTTFFDGQNIKVICDDAQMARLQRNQLFKVGAVSDHDPTKEPAKEPPPHDDRRHRGKE